MPVWSLSGRILSHSGRVRLLFCSGLNKLDEAHSHYKGSVCFTQSTDSNFNFVQKHTQRNTQNNTGSYILAPSGPIELMQKTNHHTMVLLFKSLTFPILILTTIISVQVLWSPTGFQHKDVNQLLPFFSSESMGYTMDTIISKNVVFIISFLFYSLTHNGI